MTGHLAKIVKSVIKSYLINLVPANQPQIASNSTPPTVMKSREFYTCLSVLSFMACKTTKFQPDFGTV